MKYTTRLTVIASLAALAAGCASMMPPKNPMTFFVTSAGSGKGADLGGLEGADQLCRTLASTVDAAGNRQWRAYLSTQGADAVNARDRIGRGPWQNAKGVVVARSVDELHGNNNLTKETAINEKGGIVNGRTDKPNTHDMLTGSKADGRAFPAGDDMTCGNWTKGGAEGAAYLGHHDRQGLKDDEVSRSWNSSHASRGGCSLPALNGSGGAGLFYCFAAN
jgi:hypothetical protein